MRMVLRVLVGVALVALGTALVVQNSESEVTVDLVFTSFQGVELWLVMVASLLLGALAAGLACSWPLVRYRLRLRRSRQRIAELERELHGLRTLPLDADQTEVKTRAREA